MADAALLPSGRQVELVQGRQRAVIVEVGGGIRSYSVGGDDVLDGYGSTEMCASGRGQLLLPWPNRLADGRYEFAGQEHQLPLTEPPKGTAIHGLARYATWSLAEQGQAHAVLTHRLFPQPGYPFLVDVAVTYRLDETGLSVFCSATNRGAEPCPYGSGAHPYLRIGSGLIDQLVLTSPATEVLTADERGIPTGHRAIDGTPGDFRVPHRIGDVKLDTAFAGLERGPDGRAVVSLDSPEQGRHIDMWVDDKHPYLMLFTGDTVVPERRRRGLAVEPMTCAPNAFRSGDGLIVLMPHVPFTSSWGIHATGFGD